MKNCLRYLLLMVALAACTLRSSAVTPVGTDTLYFYDSWEQVINMTPTVMMVDPVFDVYNPHELYLVTGNEELDNKLMKDHIAASIGDTWLISSYYLKRHFKGAISSFDGLVPFFFNDKLAYVTHQGKMSMSEILFGTADDYEYNASNFDIYNIDFLNRVVKKVTPEYLSELLSDYHDLQMRYEGMKDFKKREIIMEYYFKYIDRATEDIMRPFILDLVDSSPIN